MARFHQGLDQMQAKLGEALLPALKSVTGMLAGLADVMGQNQGIVSVLVPILAGLAAVVVTITTVTKIWTAVQTALDIVLNANPIGLVVVAIAALVAGVVLAYQHVDWFRSAVDAVWSVLRGFGDWVGAHWKLIIDLLLGPLGLLITNLDKVTDAVRTVIDWLGRIKDVASSAFGWLGKVGGAIGGIAGHIPGLHTASSSPGVGAIPAVSVVVYVQPGDDFPESVYRGLREYQRRHARPELRALFASSTGR
jgi:phage-related protein